MMQRQTYGEIYDMCLLVVVSGSSVGRQWSSSVFVPAASAVTAVGQNLYYCLLLRLMLASACCG